MTKANLKQRIAGGAVLVIVLAIFLPFLFSHSNVQQAPIEKPVVVSMNEVADQSSELVPTPLVVQNQHQDLDPVPVVAQVEATTDHSADNPSPPVIILEENAPMTEQWVVQIGSFTESAYAKRLLVHLQEQGMNAYIWQEPNRLVRVFVGPVSTRGQAEELKQRVKDQFRLDGIVRKKSA